MKPKATHIELEKRIRELEQEAAHFRLIIDNTSDMLSRLDPEGKYLYVSNACQGLLGYRSDELIGKSAYDFFHPDDHEMIRQSQRRSLKQNLGDSLSYRIRHKKGHYLWVETRSMAVRNPKTDTVDQVIASTRDITERKQTAKGLESQNRLMSTLLDNLQVGVFMVAAPTGKPMLSNKRAQELLGRGIMNGAEKNSLAEVYQAYRYGTEELYPQAQMPVIRAMSGEHHFIDDMEVVRPDGTKVLLEVHGSPVTDDAGHTIAGLVSFSDITERKRAQEELGEIFNMSLDLIYTADINTVSFLKVNPAFTKILGYLEDELLGKPFIDYIHPEDVAANLAVIAEDLQQGRDVVNLKNRYRCRDGSYRWLNWVAHPVPEKGIIYGVGHDISGEKQTEESLRALAHQWQSTFDAVNDSICVLDDQWTILQANKATAKILTRPQQQIIGSKCYEMVHGTSEHLENCPVRRIAESRQRETEEVRVGRRWIEVTADPIFKGDGSLQGIVHIMTDITERKEQEEALRDREETLRSIFKAAPIGIGMVCDRVITQANDHLCDMVGRSREELLHKNSRLLYPTDEDFEYVGRVKYQQIEKSGTGTVETRWKHKNGTLIDILLSSTPINIDDWSQGVTFTALDITDRKLAEKRLTAAHKMFLTVLDGIDATIYVADMETHEILFMNKYMIESFGRDMTGETCWEVFRGGTGPCPHCTNDRLVDEQGKPTGVIVWQDQNPVNQKWYINYDRAIEWIDGRLVKIQIATDITAVRKMEEGLRQAQKMESIGNLAGGIAHDFNNILFPIVGMSELLLDDLPEDSPEYENTLEILQAGKRGSDLVKQILTFSRQSEHKIMPVRIQQILKEVLKLSRSTIPANIEINQEIQSDCGLVKADPTQIHQVAMNLITNAFHAVESSGGQIVVQLKERTLAAQDVMTGPLDPGRYAVLSVSDTGHGIAPNLITKIFDPYFTTKRDGKGTGLGLSVVYGIVKEHNGDIKVYSELGKGTVFHVYLPLIEKPAAMKTNQESTPLPFGSERVLLVDDEESIVRMVSIMLRRLGYQVTARTSSLEALEAFRTDPDAFDIVITDMTMPNMTGDQLAAELMAIKPGLAVIICTGFSEALTQEKTEAMGIKGFLMKPVVKSELAQKVRDVLDEVAD